MKLVINGCKVKQSSEGMYSLTDLWKASGGKETKHPSKFERTEKFKELSEILKCRYPQFKTYIKTRGKYNGGTWSVKEMVYAYAMYVSTPFMLTVIDTFDALANDELEKAVSIAKTVTKLEMINAHKELIFHDESKSVMDKLNGITANESAYKATASDAGKALSKCRGQKADYSDKKQKLKNELQLTLSI